MSINQETPEDPKNIVDGMTDLERKIESLKNSIVSIHAEVDEIKTIIRNIRVTSPSHDVLDIELQALQKFRSGIQEIRDRWGEIDESVREEFVNVYFGLFAETGESFISWKIRWGKDYHLVEEIMRQIDKLDYQILQLGYRCGFTQQKIAEILGLSQPTIANRLWRLEHDLATAAAYRKVKSNLLAENFRVLDRLQQRFPPLRRLLAQYIGDKAEELIEIFIVPCEVESTHYTFARTRLMREDRPVIFREEEARYLRQSQSFRRQFYAFYFIGPGDVLFCTRQDIEASGIEPRRMRNMTQHDFQVLNLKYSSSLRTLLSDSEYK